MTLLLAFSLLQTPALSATPTPDASPRSLLTACEQPERPEPAPSTSLERWLPPPPPPPKPPRRGIGLLVTGGLITAGLGIPLFSVGAFALHKDLTTDCADCFYTFSAALFMPIGIVGLAVGVPLLAVGGHRLRAYRAWERKVGVSLRPHIGRDHGVWTTGFELRF